MIIVPAGFSDELAVAEAVDTRGVTEGADDALCGDAGLLLGVDSGTDALPQPVTSRQSTTATLLMRQVWGAATPPSSKISETAARSLPLLGAIRR
jgi:hypothetical protein